MRHSIFKILLMTVVIIGIVSCKKEEKSKVIITKKPVATAPRQTQRIGDYEQSMDMEWGDKAYSIYVSRHADESLPTVDDGSGNKYFDNKINVKIIRNDGSTFYSREFSKSDFSQYLDNRAKKNYAMLGVVYDRVEGDNVYFAASVGSPDIVGSDEYIPFVVRISRGGVMTIAKDTQRDITAEDESAISDADDEEGV